MLAPGGTRGGAAQHLHWPRALCALPHPNNPPPILLQLSNAATFVASAIGVSFVGRLGDLQLSAAVLAQSVFNVTGEHRGRRSRAAARFSRGGMRPARPGTCDAGSACACCRRAVGLGASTACSLAPRACRPERNDGIHWHRGHAVWPGVGRQKLPSLRPGGAGAGWAAAGQQAGGLRERQGCIREAAMVSQLPVQPSCLHDCRRALRVRRHAAAWVEPSPNLPPPPPLQRALLVNTVFSALIMGLWLKSEALFLALGQVGGLQSGLQGRRGAGVHSWPVGAVGACSPAAG